MSGIEYVVNFGEHPSIDDCGALREKLVRCKDCKYFDQTFINGICKRSESPVYISGFCAWAERKEVGDGLDAS